MKSRLLGRDRKATLGLRVAMSLLAVLCVPSGLVGQETGSAERFFDSDGVRIRYLDHGEGEAVVLLHGFALSAEVNWGLTGLLDSLPQEYRMLALDQRGHGRSDKPHDPEELWSGVRRRCRYACSTRSRSRRPTSSDTRWEGRWLSGWPRTTRTAFGPSLPEVRAGRRPALRCRPVWQEWPAKIELIAEEGGSLTDAMWQPGWPDPTPEIRAFLDSNDARALAAVLTARPEWDN